MRLSIDHRLTYRYSSPVFLEPMTIRLRPRADGRLLLHEHALEVAPAPAGTTQERDPYDNVATFAWFDGRHQSLSIHSRVDVSGRLENPYDFFVSDPGATALPVDYAGPLADALHRYRGAEEATPALASLVAEVRRGAGDRTLEYCGGLAARIREEVPTVVRAEGSTWPAERTLSEGRGACRDQAWLFVCACRAVGLAARFVSGYAFSPSDHTEQELHAWAEVYLPGPGWRGYDPSLGLAVGEAHVPLAHGPLPGDAAATSGAFRGDGARESMSYEVAIERVGG